MSLWKAATRLPILCAHPCSLPVESRLLVPMGSFVLGEAVIPLPDTLHEGEWSLLMQQEIPTQLLCSPRPEPSFSPGVEKPQSLRSFHYLQKTCFTQFPWFPSLWSERFSCVNLCHTLSTTLFLSPFSIPEESVTFPPGCGNFSLPSLLPRTLHLLCYLTPTMEVLLPIFWLISWMFQWSDLNIAMFEGQGKPRAPLFLCHLNSFLFVF